MTLGVCITTRHRPELLEECLAHIERSTVKPARVVVSDDSSRPESIEETARVVAKFARATYVAGPRKGVCANRNNALAVLTRDDAATS
jgi:glycosyltransferase involved in cell wall biosynthesis